MLEPNANAETFMKEMLPLYHGPLIKIRVKPSNTEMTISKDLLCAKSPVFTKMLNSGDFKESQEQVLDLEEMDDVVSVRAIGALIHWLYQGIINFNIESPEEDISAAMELARFADMYGIDGLEAEMAEYIRKLLCYDDDFAADPYGVNRSTYYLRQNHILSGLNLPRGHAVRRLLAAASVEGYLQSDNYKFAEMTQEYPLFGLDLLQEVKLALRTTDRGLISLTDPIHKFTICADTSGKHAVGNITCTSPVSSYDGNR